MRKSLRMFVVAAGAITFATLVVIIFRRTRPAEPLTHVASRVYAQVLAGNSTGLYDMAMPDDIKELHYTHKTVDEMSRWASHCFQGYSPFEPRIDKKAALGGLYTEYYLKNARGDVVELTLVFYDTPSGPKTFLDQIVPAAVHAKYVQRFNDVLKDYEANVMGFEDEQATLARFSSGNLWGNFPQQENRFVTWQEEILAAKRSLKLQRDHLVSGVIIPGMLYAASPVKIKGQ